MIDWGNKVTTEANRWHENVTQFGFSRIPNALFYYSGVLGLNPGELGFLCLLLSHMRYKNLETGKRTKIYPSLSNLANYKIDSTRQTLGKFRTSLEEKGLIRCNQLKGGNFEFDPSGLFALLVYLVEKDKEIQDKLKYEYQEGTVPDKIEADDKRYKELKIYLHLRKVELGI